MNLQTPLALKILETLAAANGQWLNRQEVAARMGRQARLPRYDRNILDALAAAGVIERQTRPCGVVMTEYAYRLPPAGEQPGTTGQE